MLSWAQPGLTTISDVLFKADGTRFNGLAQITWMTFESSNGSYIAQQSKTIRIIDGNLFAQLTPTTNAVPQSVYSVKYSSDGRIQFLETWAVPPSTVKLRVRDVRTTDPAFPGSGGGIGQVTQIQESDVVGLVADLAAADAGRMPEPAGQSRQIERITLPRLAVAAGQEPLPLVLSYLQSAEAGC